MNRLFRAFLPSALCFLPFCADAETLHHISIIGQSLALGWDGSPALSTSQPYSNLFSSAAGTSFVPLVENRKPAGVIVESSLSGIANQISFMALASAPSVSWATLADNYDAAGSSRYDYLKKGTSYFTNWQTALHASTGTAAANGYDWQFGAIANIHGESDDNLDRTDAVYEADLVEWQRDMAADVSSATVNPGMVPMFISQEDSWCAVSSAKHTPTTSSGVRGVPMGQLDAARHHPHYFYMVGPKYQFPYANFVHMTNEGYLQLGELMGKAMYGPLVRGRPWTGLVPRDISINGNTITCRLWVPSGQIVIDTNSFVESPMGNYGFEFFETGGSRSISSVAITSNDTVTITLIGSAGTSPRLRFAYTGTIGPTDPPGTSSAGSPHGNIRDTDTTVGQKSGAHLYDWLATFDDPIPFAWSPPATVLVGNIKVKGRGHIL